MSPTLLRAAQAAAQQLGLKGQVLEVSRAEEFQTAFASFKTAGAQAVIQLASPFLNAHRKRLSDLAASHRLPMTCEQRQFVADGCLMSYGPSFEDMVRRSAGYVDKILKGAKPADLPVEQPTKFELVINLKTAKVLGLTIPQTILLRADQVIDP
jgi:putative ABC transport system substrate-binding protein